MPSYSISIPDDLNTKVVTRAKQQKLSVQDYIRLLLRLDTGGVEGQRWEEKR